MSNPDGRAPAASGWGFFFANTTEDDQRIMAAVEQEITDIKLEHAELQSQCTDLERERAELKRKIDAFEKELGERQGIDKDERIAFRGQIAGMDIRIAGMDNKIAAMDNKIAACKNQIVACKNQIVAKEADKAAKEANVCGMPLFSLAGCVAKNPLQLLWFVLLCALAAAACWIWLGPLGAHGNAVWDGIKLIIILITSQAQGFMTSRRLIALVVVVLMFALCFWYASARGGSPPPAESKE